VHLRVPRTPICRHDRNELVEVHGAVTVQIASIGDDVHVLCGELCVRAARGAVTRNAPAELNTQRNFEIAQRQRWRVVNPAVVEDAATALLNADRAARPRTKERAAKARDGAITLLARALRRGALRSCTIDTAASA
jgi:hypothetical protein